MDNYIKKTVNTGESVQLEMNMDTGEFKATFKGEIVGTKNLKGKKLFPFV